MLGLIATASRLGSIFSSFIYGTILNITKSWRKTFAFSSIIQLFIWIFYMSTDRFVRIDTNRKVSEINSSDSLESFETVPQVLTRVSRSQKFWLMFIGKIALMTVGQFISFIPLYLTTGIKLEPSKAAVYSAGFSVGSICIYCF